MIGKLLSKQPRGHSTSAFQTSSNLLLSQPSFLLPSTPWYLQSEVDSSLDLSYSILRIQSSVLQLRNKSLTLLKHLKPCRVVASILRSPVAYLNGSIKNECLIVAGYRNYEVVALLVFNTDKHGGLHVC